MKSINEKIREIELEMFDLNTKLDSLKQEVTTKKFYIGKIYKRRKYNNLYTILKIDNKIKLLNITDSNFWQNTLNYFELLMKFPEGERSMHSIVFLSYSEMEKLSSGKADEFTEIKL